MKSKSVEMETKLVPDAIVKGEIVSVIVVGGKEETRPYLWIGTERACFTTETRRRQLRTLGRALLAAANA